MLARTDGTTQAGFSLGIGGPSLQNQTAVAGTSPVESIVARSANGTSLVPVLVADATNDTHAVNLRTVMALIPVPPVPDVPQGLFSAQGTPWPTR